MVYILPCVEGDHHFHHALRFVSTYLAFPPLVFHKTIIVANGGKPPDWAMGLFSAMPDATWLYRPEQRGWDIGAYQDIAETDTSDLMVCFGEYIHFHREGWLQRIEEVWREYGPGMYGATASYQIRGHIQTTGFCATPQIIRNYPVKASTKEERYEFEHGEGSLTERTIRARMPCMLVTWDGQWIRSRWRQPNNIIWKGDQSNCLWWTSHTDHYRRSDYQERLRLGRIADGL